MSETIRDTYRSEPEPRGAPPRGHGADDSIDIASRSDVHKLKPHAVGLIGVLFMALAGSAPLTAMLGNVPIAVASGNGVAAPGGFIFAAAAFVLFAVGYVAMVRRYTAAGGFYAFISHGLGRVAGMAAGWAGMAAYAVFEASLIGIFAYYFRNTIQSYTGLVVPWPVLAVFGIALIGVLAYLDIRVSAKVLGVATGLEMLLLLVMDLFVTAKGGGPSGLPLSPLSPIHAFQGLGIAKAAPGVGIFFALWSWIGFEAAANYAEESREPRRNIPRATYIAVLGLGVLYTWSAYSAIVGHGLAEAPKAAASNPVTFFYTVTTRFVGKPATDLMEILIVSSTFACAMAFHNAATRYFYSMGREKVLHHRLGRTHHTWQSPHVASVFQSLLAALLVGGMIVLWYASRAAQNFANFQNLPYFEIYGWFAILGTFWILLLMMGSSIATAVNYFTHVREHSAREFTRLVVAPSLAALAFLWAIYLLWTNLATLGGSIVFVNAIPWVGVAWVVIGAVGALWLRGRDRARYEAIGRMVHQGL